MARYLVFDVNETLLDVAALDPFFERLFGDARTRLEWFLTLEENWLTATIIDRYQPFGELAQGALIMTGQRRGIDVTEDQQQELVEGLKTLPPHADVLQALQSLHDHGLHLTALTNGSLDTAKQQLQSAGLMECFDAIMAVEEVKRYKPAPEPYRMVAERLGVSMSDMMLVAAHAWDIAGAASAGCQTAFVSRPGKVLNPVGIQPNLQGNGMQEVAERILARQS
ncbi:2-haloacid dehalogenase [Modicisalibacter xianhensis]|uniref:(S)-2-haloacid dehalogenase n=1 Tax=Modicisalibacter xianhensis TaxID=442341 RepID=A0A4V3GS99_9GAMM|nr:haloacid dehalogenase type II [Halomonas xianhensis]TDX22143.1 2-haloacid dehalogenase [Halomonas xianhensis]